MSTCKDFDLKKPKSPLAFEQTLVAYIISLVLQIHFRTYWLLSSSSRTRRTLFRCTDGISFIGCLACKCDKKAPGVYYPEFSEVSGTSLWDAPTSDSVLRLLKLARCISRTSACTTSDMGGRNSGSGYTCKARVQNIYMSAVTTKVDLPIFEWYVV